MEVMLMMTALLVALKLMPDVLLVLRLFQGLVTPGFLSNIITRETECWTDSVLLYSLQ